MCIFWRRWQYKNYFGAITQWEKNNTKCVWKSQEIAMVYLVLISYFNVPFISNNTPFYQLSEIVGHFSTKMMIQKSIWCAGHNPVKIFLKVSSNDSNMHPMYATKSTLLFKASIFQSNLFRVLIILLCLRNILNVFLIE